MSAATDPGIFAERLLGRPLWPYQLDFARSDARYRIVCAGRQVGKSTVLSVIALFEAATRRGILVLLVSAGEAASQRLLRECATLAASSDVLRGSVLDESKSSLTLSNGSRILSVPASERQIRGNPVDLLCIDEAAFVAEEIWQSAEPAIAARPGSRVILTSTPFGVDHFFRRLWQRGMSAPDAMYASWHWPSSVSPLMDRVLLEDIRSRENPIIFAREYEAEWADESGLLLTPDELEGAVLDYDLIDPGLVDSHGHRRTRHYATGQSESNWELPRVVAGVDWGSARDANAVALVGLLDDAVWSERGVPGPAGGAWPEGYVFFIPWLEVHYRSLYRDFVDRVTFLATKYNIQQIASETNGVGAFPTEELARQIDRAHAAGQLPRWTGLPTFVQPVWTDNRRKQAMFGRLKGLLQSGRLVLPRHVELLKQLAALEMTETASGSTQISVPDRFGHDDLADALGQALSCIGTTWRSPGQRYWPRPPARAIREVAVLGRGTRVPLPPQLLDPDDRQVFESPAAGTEQGLPW